jgi:hypothetical protein
MKLRTYLRLFDRAEFAVLMICPLLMSGLFVGIGAAMGRPFTETGRAPLFFAALFIPVFASLAFTLPINCPGIALLPGAHRGLLRWHAVLIGLVSITGGTVLHLVYPACPSPLGTMICAAYVSTFLVTNPMRSPYGATYAAPLVLLTLFATGLGSRLFAHPFWSGGIAFAHTAGCFFRASSGTHRRRFAGPTATRRLIQAAPQRSPNRGSLLPSFTLWRNLRAVHHRASLWSMIAIGIGASPMTFLTLAILKPGAGGFIATIHNLITHPGEWQLGNPGMMAFLALVTPYAGRGRRLPPFVPLSRRSLPLITLTSSFLFLGTMLAASTGAILATGFLTGRIVGQPLNATIAAQVVISGTLWLAAAPLLNPWSSGNPGDRFLTISFVALLAQVGQKVLFDWGLLPAAIIWTALIAFTHLAYYFELKRRFATRDLVDLSAVRSAASMLRRSPAN